MTPEELTAQELARIANQVQIISTQITTVSEYSATLVGFVGFIALCVGFLTGYLVSKGRA